MKFGALLLFVSWARTLFTFFRRMGALGLLLLGIGDSSFLFVPLSNDLLLIALVSGKRESWVWVLYTLAAALGSLIGVALVDWVMRKAGEEGLGKLVSPKQLAKLKAKMEKRGAWAVFFATLLPPPFPFTAVVAAASALQCARGGMFAAVFVGRVIRFTAESLLALHFGRRLLRYLRSDIVEYFVYGFIVLAIVGSVLTARKWLRTRPRHAVEAH